MTSYNSNYQRVIPRDLFNEAKLLKCIGRLTLLIHDEMAPNGIKFKHNGAPFNVVYTSDGSLSISNVFFIINDTALIFKTTVNDKGPFPLLCEYEYEDHTVFNEEGNFSNEFIEFCTRF